MPLLADYLPSHETLGVAIGALWVLYAVAFFLFWLAVAVSRTRRFR